MNLLKKYWKKLSENYKKVNFDYLFNVIFYLMLCVGCIYLIYSIQDNTAEEMIEDMQAISSERIKRNRIIPILILKYLGKEGYYIFVVSSFIIVFKYRFLPNLRKFLGKEVEKEKTL